jgi:hypothetical protein
MAKNNRNIEMTQVTEWKDGEAACVEDYLAAEEPSKESRRPTKSKLHAGIAFCHPVRPQRTKKSRSGSLSGSRNWVA